MIGLKTNTVELLPHTTEWEEIAEKTIKLIQRILGDVCIDVQHVGSTSIKWVSAKPIIDIAVAVNELNDVMPYVNVLKENGIVYRKVEDTGQILFLMGDLENDIKTHHIHIVKANSSNWYNYLNFRDYLNARPSKAKEYDELKRKLTIKYSDNRKAYTLGKSKTISKILCEAQQWRNSQK